MHELWQNEGNFCPHFTALHCMQRGLSDEHLSVCLSVRLSVKRVNCDKTKAPSEKSSIMTNRKSPTCFPMSLRWTAYVAPNPPKGASKATIFFVFRIKMDFPRRKSVTKFLCVKTFSVKVVRHSLAYLSVPGPDYLVCQLCHGMGPPGSRGPPVGSTNFFIFKSQ